MSPWPEALNAALLFLCISMYFGTGRSMGLFSFPIRSRVTVDNDYLLVVPEVAAATKFFTWMAMMMIASAAAMVWTEWGTPLLFAQTALNWVRIALWSVQWALMILWFIAKARAGAAI